MWCVGKLILDVMNTGTRRLHESRIGSPWIPQTGVNDLWVFLDAPFAEYRPLAHSIYIVRMLPRVPVLGSRLLEPCDYTEIVCVLHWFGISVLCYFLRGLASVLGVQSAIKQSELQRDSTLSIPNTAWISISLVLSGSAAAYIIIIKW